MRRLPREARYYYHRALILAENKRLADAAKASRQSMEIEGSNSAPGKPREPQCHEINQLALAPAQRVIQQTQRKGNRRAFGAAPSFNAIARDAPPVRGQAFVVRGFC
jgi:hypothetical protein